MAKQRAILFLDEQIEPLISDRCKKRKESKPHPDATTPPDVLLELLHPLHHHHPPRRCTVLAVKSNRIPMQFHPRMCLEKVNTLLPPLRSKPCTLESARPRSRHVNHFGSFALIPKSARLKRTSESDTPDTSRAKPHGFALALPLALSSLQMAERSHAVPVQQHVPSLLRLRPIVDSSAMGTQRHCCVLPCHIVRHAAMDRPACATGLRLGHGEPCADACQKRHPRR